MLLTSGDIFQNLALFLLSITVHEGIVVKPLRNTLPLGRGTSGWVFFAVKI
jgi:hypothetical protein